MAADAGGPLLLFSVAFSSARLHSPLAVQGAARFFLLVLLSAVFAGCGRNSPYTGVGWYEVSKPLSGTNAIAGVEAFLRTNGWQMQTGDVMFFRVGDKMRPLTGIPWKGLTRKHYLGITCDGILYIPLRGFGPESGGIAYNPKTNRFPSTINGFVPVGCGWYAWKQTMDPRDEQRY